MKNKVLLVLVDGMRPDAVMQCESSFLRDLRAESTYTFSADTVYPSVTLPCHTSLFLSVDPDRHGITTNFWMPQVRPIDGICEIANRAGMKCAMFYNWQELRDLCRPGTLHYAHFHQQNTDMKTEWQNEVEMTVDAIRYIQKESPDFVFVYLGAVDEIGHHYGWMGKEYMQTVSHASECIRLLRDALPEEYQLIVTADHGGHGQSHGTEMPEDMMIPLICHGTAFEKGRQLEKASIKDIAPTIAALLQLQPAAEWTGHSLV